jgi:hypothetical protein
MRDATSPLSQSRRTKPPPKQDGSLEHLFIVEEYEHSDVMKPDFEVVPG